MAPAENLPANRNKHFDLCLSVHVFVLLNVFVLFAHSCGCSLPCPEEFPGVPPFPDHLLLSSIACPHTYPECGPRHADTQMHAHGHAAWWSIIEKEPIPFLIKVCVHGFRCVFRLQPGDQPVLDDSRKMRKKLWKKETREQKGEYRELNDGQKAGIIKNAIKCNWITWEIRFWRVMR